MRFNVLALKQTLIEKAQLSQGINEVELLCNLNNSSVLPGLFLDKKERRVFILEMMKRHLREPEFFSTEMLSDLQNIHRYFCHKPQKLATFEKVVKANNKSILVEQLMKKMSKQEIKELFELYKVFCEELNYEKNW